jgi:transcription elongation factor Elf1
MGIPKTTAKHKLCPKCSNSLQVDTRSNETFGLHQTQGFMYCSSCNQSWPIWMSKTVAEIKNYGAKL